ncbi:amidohydrolase family protein [Rhizorhabdus dicambivorans]|uniref:Amidohydrolase family protein n=1 Tax=Rhizorhabdus dicambivorans TaxID=1850238 RepID=A0A2A4FSE4_9SPHN|nr:amidohydrolase family protein [Rhizorhabdus dicambivorans]ATE65810.1 amidohydrolase family protein [Rhizorhabdus dicambivorans]PCE41107.1 amidohydrolase family protein [Rhizorhabdus dicambivorans]
MRKLIRSGLIMGLLLAAPAQLWAKDIAVHAGRLIDGVSKAPRSNMTILIRDDRIISVTPGFTTPVGAEVVDLSRLTVLPGLIDCHVHLSFDLFTVKLPPQLQIVKRSSYDELLTAVESGRRTLMAGFTSVRDVAGYTPAMAALKNAVKSGGITGPRMWISGTPLGPTGGHSDLSNGFDAQVSKAEWRDAVIDGPDEAVKSVRQHHKGGADVIKITISGGTTTEGDNPHAQLMSDAEIQAVVDTAHVLGMKVAAHVQARGAIGRAAALGVDTIEHGTFADAADYNEMKAKGAWFVPTPLVAKFKADVARSRPEMFSASAASKLLSIDPLLENLGRAHKAGVKIAFGTDAGVVPHGQNAQGFALLVRSGLTPMEAIQTATASAAEAIGAAEDIGTIQPGRYADLVATANDPLADITELERIKFVMKGGSVVRANIAPQP